jgi:hypothetical protein
MSPANPDKLEVDTSVQASELIAPPTGTLSLSSNTASTNSVHAAVTQELIASDAASDDDDAIVAALVAKERERKRLYDYKNRMQTVWFFIVWIPIAFCYFGLNRGPWYTLVINMFLYTWGFWTGLQESFFGIAQIVNLPMHLHAFDESTWAPVAATVLCIVSCQLVMILARVQQQPSGLSTATNPSSTYPLPTLRISFTYLMVSLLMAIALLLWARAVTLLRWIMQALALSSASIAFFLFLQVCFILLARGGGITSFMRDNHMTVVYCMIRLTSIASVLVSKLVSSESIQAACCYTFLALASISAQPISSSTPNDETVVAHGNFAPETRRKSLRSCMAFLALTATILLPLIVSLMPTSRYLSWLFTTFPEYLYLFWLVFLVFLLRFIGKPKPLKWTIVVAKYHVHLSVEVVGSTRKYYNVVHAAKRSSILPLIPRRRSFITSAITHNDDGVVIVSYVPVRNVLYQGATISNDLHMELTPEDPDAFLEMMTVALDQRKPRVTFRRGEDGRLVIGSERDGEKNA